MKYTESLEFMTLQKQITVGVICGHILLFLEFVNKRIHPGIFFCTFCWLYQEINSAIH